MEVYRQRVVLKDVYTAYFACVRGEAEIGYGREGYVRDVETGRPFPFVFVL